MRPPELGYCSTIPCGAQDNGNTWEVLLRNIMSAAGRIGDSSCNKLPRCESQYRRGTTRVEGVTQYYVWGGGQGQRSALLWLSWAVLYNWRDL